MSEDAVVQRVREILAAVKPLAAEYYRLTGKPLGVTGEVAEYVAAEILGLELVPPLRATTPFVMQTTESSVFRSRAARMAMTPSRGNDWAQSKKARPVTLCCLSCSTIGRWNRAKCGKHRLALSKSYSP